MGDGAGRRVRKAPQDCLLVYETLVLQVSEVLYSDAYEDEISLELGLPFLASSENFGIGLGGPSEEWVDLEGRVGPLARTRAGVRYTSERLRFSSSRALCVMDLLRQMATQPLVETLGSDPGPDTERPSRQGEGEGAGARGGEAETKLPGGGGGASAEAERVSREETEVALGKAQLWTKWMSATFRQNGPRALATPEQYATLFLRLVHALHDSPRVHGAAGIRKATTGLLFVAFVEDREGAVPAPLRVATVSVCQRFPALCPALVATASQTRLAAVLETCLATFLRATTPLPTPLGSADRTLGQAGPMPLDSWRNTPFALARWAHVLGFRGLDPPRQQQPYTAREKQQEGGGGGGGGACPRTHL